MLHLKPGMSSLQDVYNLLGYPLSRRDFSTGVVLGYPCEHIKFRHIVLVDGISGGVLLVGAVVYRDGTCPQFDELKTQYGEPVMAIQHGRRRHWFFEGHDMADTEMVLQILPPGTTLEQYQLRDGYFEESYAFTP
jgi:hypothetical protein